MNNKLKKCFIVLLILAVVICLPSCADLGDYEDLFDYYSYFSAVGFYRYNDSNKAVMTACPMSSLYNEDTTDHDMDGACATISTNYCFIQIPVAKDANIESVAFYLKSSCEESVKVKMSVYKISTLTINAKNLEKRDLLYGTYYYNVLQRNYQTKQIEVVETKKLVFDGTSTSETKGHVTVSSVDATTSTETTYGTYEYSFDEESLTATFNVTYSITAYEQTTDYDYAYTFVLSDDYNSATVTLYDNVSKVRLLPNEYTYDESAQESAIEGAGSMLTSGYTTLKPNEWGSITLDDWDLGDGSGTQKTVTVNQYESLVIQIDNNGTWAKRNKLEEVEFKVTNLMIRRIK